MFPRIRNLALNLVVILYLIENVTPLVTCPAGRIPLVTFLPCITNIQCMMAAPGFTCIRGVCCSGGPALAVPEVPVIGVGLYGIGARCANSAQCTTGFSHCLKNRCACLPGYNYDGNACVSVTTITTTTVTTYAFGDDCTDTAQCTTANSNCFLSVCACIPGYYYDDVLCTQATGILKAYPIGAGCATSAQCLSTTPFSQCSWSWCNCLNGYHFDGNKCVIGLEGTIKTYGIGASCTTTSQCLSTNDFSRCRYNKCVCNPGFRYEAFRCANNRPEVPVVPTVTVPPVPVVQGQVKMYLSTDKPLECKGPTTCTFADFPHCVRSARYNHMVCCSTPSCP